MNHLVFVDRLLAQTHISVLTLFLSFFTIGVIHLIRNRYEGMAYNFCLSSEIGDLFLIALIAMGAEQMKSANRVPGFLGTVSWQVIAFTLGALLATAWSLGVEKRDGHYSTPSDFYHNTFVVWLFTLLSLISSAPLLFIPSFGGTAEKAFAWFLLLLYIFSVVFDKKTGRAQQLKWFVENRPWEDLLITAQKYV